MDLFKIAGTIALAGAAKAQADIKETSGSASKFSENLKKGITTAAQWSAAVGTAAIGVAKALSNMATSSAATADNIDKMSQKIGISREAYQELEFICSQSGTSVDTLQAGMKTLTSAMDGAASGTKNNIEQFKKLGVSVTKSDGSLRSQEEVMWETMAALQKMDNQTEKARLTTELFGKSGTELMPLLNGAAGSIEDMKGQAHELGLVLDDETIDSGVELTDTMDQMKRALQTLVTKLGGKLMPILTKVCNYVIKSLPKIEDIFNKLEPVLESIFDTLMPILLDLIDEVLPIISDLLSQILPVIADVAKAILPIIADVLGMILPPLSQIIEAILPPLQAALEILVPILTAALDILKPILDVAVSLMQPIMDLASDALTGLAEAFGFSTEKTSAAVQAAMDEAEAMRNMKAAADEARDAIDQKAEKELANVSTTEQLWGELKNLCDEQGNVAAKDKERADFLTNQLQEALGIEIQWTGNQISNYKDLQTEIDKTIEKKKAEILLSASEEKYKEAILKRSEAENTLTAATKERQAALDEANRLEEQFHEAQKNGSYIEVEIARQAMMEANEIYSQKNQAYLSAAETVRDYTNDISDYETAQTLMLQGETEKAIAIMDKKGKAFKSAADMAEKSAEEQKEALKQQAIDAALTLETEVNNYNKYKDTMTESQREGYEKQIKQAQDFLTKTSQEYTKAGGEIGTDFFNSISSEMTPKRYEALGSYMIDGIASGIKGNKVKIMQELAQVMVGKADSISINMASSQPKFATGGIVKKATSLIAGEDGAEAIVPLEKNTGWISQVANNMITQLGSKRTSNNTLAGGNAGKSDNSDVVDKLNELIKAISSQKIYINGDTLVGEIAPAMDETLGQVYAGRARGR